MILNTTLDKLYFIILWSTRSIRTVVLRLGVIFILIFHKINKGVIEMKTGALYVRVSTDDQVEYSPDAQIRLGLEYAKKNNIIIPKQFIFQDDGISGRKATNRPAFQELIAMAKSDEHPIDVILVWKFSRFARNQEEAIVYKNLLKKADVDVVSVSEPIPDGFIGELVQRIFEWMDEYYSINLSGEVMRGMTERASRGGYNAAPPLGYKMQDGIPVIVPEQAEIVKKIFTWYVDDKMSFFDIAVKRAIFVVMEEDLKTAVEIMRKGGVILYPTDTIWGIGCDATNAEAVDKVYKIKKRANNKAMLVLVGKMEDVENYVETVPEMAYQLNELSEKPITIIYDNALNLAQELLGDNSSVGIRVSREVFTQRLCKMLRKPIVSTSANIAGEPSPAFFDEISDEIKSAVDYIVKYRQDDKTPHAPSSVVMLSADNTIKILRP